MANQHMTTCELESLASALDSVNGFVKGKHEDIVLDWSSVVIPIDDINGDRLGAFMMFHDDMAFFPEA